MGLDIYLKHCDNIASKILAEQEFEKLGLNWDEYKSDEFQAAIKKFGLNEDGEYPSKTIEIDSEKYPEHLFKIGYFRSSYNGSGFDSVVGNAIGKDLYYIFEVSDDTNNRPLIDWEKALERCNEVMVEWVRHVENSHNFDVMEIPGNYFTSFDTSGIDSPKASLNAFLGEFKKEKRAFGDYGNNLGDFYFEHPVKIYAFIYGTRAFMDRPVPIVYGIFKNIDEHFDFYTQALEITKETIEYVLSQPDSQNYYFRWSA